MRFRRRKWIGGLSIAVIAGVLSCGCAATDAPAAGQPDDGQLQEINCEAALIELERLIMLRSSQEGFPRVALLEAKELHRLGRELYLEREYSLALEMIEEGIQLVEEHH